MNSNNQITLNQLARLKEEAARANSAYDAARKAYKAQQKAEARVSGLEAGNRSLHDLRKGSTGTRVYSVPCVPCMPTMLTASEVVTGEAE